MSTSTITIKKSNGTLHIIKSNSMATALQEFFKSNYINHEVFTQGSSWNIFLENSFEEHEIDSEMDKIECDGPNGQYAGMTDYPFPMPKENPFILSSENVAETLLNGYVSSNSDHDCIHAFIYNKTLYATTGKYVEEKENFFPSNFTNNAFDAMLIAFQKENDVSISFSIEANSL